MWKYSLKCSILWWHIIRYFAYCSDILCLFCMFHSQNHKRKGKEKKRETGKSWKTFAKELEKSPRRTTLSRSRATRSQRMIPFSFLPLLRGQTRFSRYPSRAAASSFASSRRRFHPTRRVECRPQCPRILLFQQHPLTGAALLLWNKIHLSLKYISTMLINNQWLTAN